MADTPAAPDGGTPRRPLIYVSYSRRDRKIVEQMLAVVQPQLPEAEVFYDVLITPGDDLGDTLSKRLDEASIVLFCLSVDWLNSSNCQREMETALRGQGKRLIPIVLKPCNWFSTPLARFLALPLDAKPVSTWTDRREAFDNIARGIRTVVDNVAAVRAGVPAGHTARVRRIVVSPDGTRVISASDDRTVLVWDAAAMVPASVLKTDDPVVDAAITADGKTVVTSSGSTLLTSGVGFASYDRQPLKTKRPVVAIAALRDEVIAVTASEAFLVKARNVGALMPSLSLTPDVSFTALAGSTDGWTWVAGLSNGTCDLYQASVTFRLRRVSKAAIVEIRPLVDGVHYVSCSADGNVQVFAFEGDQREFSVSPSPLAGICPTPDGKYAAVAAADGVKLIDLTSGAIVRDWPLSGDSATAVAVTPDGARIIWGTAKGTVSVRPLDTTTQRPLPVGEDRLRLAYLAALELPELWAVLESLDESALAGLGAQLQLAPDQDVLQALQNKRPGVEPPPLWVAWITSMYPSKVGKPQAPR